jgi:transcriptional regulator with XRE-family HTH domain
LRKHVVTVFFTMKKTQRERRKYHFANWFKTIRKEKGLTQEAAAEKLKIQASTVSRWESGAEPRAAHLHRIFLWSGAEAEKLLKLVSRMA